MRYFFLIYMLMGAVVDIRTKKLPAMWIYSGLIITGCYGGYGLWAGSRLIGEFVCALIPALLCFFLARISGAMGEGDAFVIGMIGLVFKMTVAMQILILAFFLAAAGSAILLVVKKDLKNRRIPFVPYVFLSTLFGVVGG